MLIQYRTDTRNLLQNPSAPAELYATVNIDRWVNIARGQMAGEAECVRVLGTVQTVVGQRNYAFSELAIGTPATTGIQGIIHVRRINVGIASGQQYMTPRPWPWFDQYHMNNVVPQNGTPEVWAQYAQGSAGTETGSDASGSFYVDPPPDDVYTLTCDCVCYPITLVDDDTVEAIPYLWTDAVPFFAATYALWSSQTSAREADADRMYARYQTFLERARKASNPGILRWQYEQAADIPQAAKLGMKQPAGGG